MEVPGSLIIPFQVMANPKLLMLICTRPLLIPFIKVLDCSSSKTLIYEL